MKDKFLHGAAALALCAGFVACSEYDAGVAPETLAEIKSLQYETAFVQKFGKIDPTQDWGFGSTNVTETRAQFEMTWEKDHVCEINKDLFNFSRPNDAVNLTQGSFTDGEKKAKAFYIPSGEHSLNNSFSISAGAKIYIEGTVSLDASSITLNGQVTFYISNGGSVTYGQTSGGRHTFINNGELIVTAYDNIGDVHNNGILRLERGHNKYWPNEGGSADIPNAMSIYSTKDVELPDGSDFKAACDIHGTLSSYKDLKIQNDNTQYVCAVVVDGTLDMTAGKLETSYIEATKKITFDGAHIWLLPEGHIKADEIRIANSACEIYGYKGSHALVEARNFKFGNDNDFTHTFSNNIFFNVTGRIDIGKDLDGNYLGGCYAHGGEHHYDNVAEYLKNTEDEHHLVADRINKGNISANNGCVDWGTTPDPEKQPVLKRRVFCEDLGAIGDFDFNDVVFDVIIYDDSSVDIKVLAAGGTLYIEVAGEPIHPAMPYMVNTGAGATCEPYVIRTRTTADLNDTNALLQYIKGIEIKVIQTDSEGEVSAIVLTAEEGKAPMKICVPEGTRWMQEYIRINTGYKKFSDWVNGYSSLENTFNESNADPSLLY